MPQFTHEEHLSDGAYVAVHHGLIVLSANVHPSIAGCDKLIYLDSIAIDRLFNYIQRISQGG